MTGSGLSGPVAVYFLLDATYRSENYDYIPVYAGLALISYAAYACLTSAYYESAQRMTESIVFDLKCRLISALMKKPIQFHDEVKHGALISVVVRDVERLSDFLRNYAIPIFSGTIFSVLILIVLIVVDNRLGLLVLGIVPVMLYAIMKDFSGKTAAEAPLTDVDERQNAALADVFNAARTIRVFQIRTDIEQWFRAGAREVRDYFLIVNRGAPFGWGAFARFVGTLIWLAPLILALGLLVWGVGGITVGLIVLFKTYAPMLTANLNSVGIGLLEYAKLGSTLTRLHDVFAYPEERDPDPPSLQAMPDGHHLAVRDLKYVRADRTIFKGVNFAFAGGEHVGIIGASGAGKSTFGDLLLRLETPSEGNILLDGQDAQNFSLPLYLSYFAHVPQQVHVFNTTIRDNIALGWRHVPDADIERAARLVRLHETITAMPAGYQTVMRPSSVPLSAGQRQRLGLARAIIREPAILILDEFTAMLDPETETAVLEDMLAAFPGTTIVCVTHSPAVMERMDRILRLPDGAVLSPETAVSVADAVRSSVVTARAQANTATNVWSEAWSANAITLDGQQTELPRLAEWVGLQCETLQVPESVRFELDLVLEELVSNVINHGEVEGEKEAIRVDLSRRDGELVITVVDTGRQFDPTQSAAPDTTAHVDERRVGGLGLHLVRGYMDNVTYDRVGDENHVVLRKTLAPVWISNAE